MAGLCLPAFLALPISVLTFFFTSLSLSSSLFYTSITSSMPFRDATKVKNADEHGKKCCTYSAGNFIIWQIVLPEIDHFSDH